MEVEQIIANSIKNNALCHGFYKGIEQCLEERDDAAEFKKSLQLNYLRLLFCVYADYSNFFSEQRFFHNIESMTAYDVKRFLIDLYDLMSRDDSTRNIFLDPDFAAFPYIKGELFKEQSIEIVIFSDELYALLIKLKDYDFSDNQELVSFFKTFI